MKMPTAGTPYNFSDIIAAKIGFIKSENNIISFENILSNYFQVENVRLVNSGTTACYILLKYLKSIRKNENQTEIIITNYTAPSLTLPIEKAGLDCVVVDTSKEDFNMDISKISNLISEKTLAIMPVHMFGIPTDIQPIIDIANDKNIFIIEDAASSMGSKINNIHTGTLADFGFHSLNRGKNISTLAGGIIVWKNVKHNAGIQQLIDDLPKLSISTKFKMLMKFFALTLAVRPIFYSILNFFISKFKYTSLHIDFDSFVYTSLQAEIGKNLWKREKKLTLSRIKNGKELTKIFQDINGIQIPLISDNVSVAFNQFPIIINDIKKMKSFSDILLSNGIETSNLYEKTLHQIFPDFIKNSNVNFPNSEYLAEHLLLIPPHPQIKQKHLNIIKKSVNQIFK